MLTGASFSLLGPGAVGHLSFTEILGTSLKVSWQEPLEKNGIIAGKWPCPPKSSRFARHTDTGVASNRTPAARTCVCGLWQQAGAQSPPPGPGHQEPCSFGGIFLLGLQL